MPSVNDPVARVRLLTPRVPSLTTFLAIAVFTPAVAGCLLLLSWLQHRTVAALGV
jgi:hypothetical protein